MSVVQSADRTPEPPARGRRLRRGAVGTATALLVGLAAASPAPLGRCPEVPASRTGRARPRHRQDRVGNRGAAIGTARRTPGQAQHHRRRPQPNPRASSSSTRISLPERPSRRDRHDPDLIRSGADELSRGPGRGFHQRHRRANRPDVPGDCGRHRPGRGRRADPAHRRIRTDDDQARHRCGEHRRAGDRRRKRRWHRHIERGNRRDHWTRRLGYRGFRGRICSRDPGRHARDQRQRRRRRLRWPAV